MRFVWSDGPGLADAGYVPMQQHPVYGAACERLGTRALGLQLPGGLGSAIAIQRRWPLFGTFALLSRGPVWSDRMEPLDRRRALQALIEHLGDRHRGVIVTPDRNGGQDPLEGAPLLRLMSPCHMARLTLAGTSADRRARLAGKWRNRLRQAEAAGIAVKDGPLPLDPGHWLLRREAQQARDRGYRRLSAAFTTAWAEAGGKDATRLFTAWQRGDILAAMLFLVHGPTASYHIGWSGADGRRVHAHSLLMWHAMEWAAARGLGALDLGTLDTETTPGLARFKLGTGAEAVALGATHIGAPGTRAVAWLFRQGRRNEAPVPFSA